MVSQEFLNLKETAAYLGDSYRTIKKEYRSWPSLYGITPSRRCGRREIKFKRTDLDLLQEKTKIYQPVGVRLAGRS